MSKTPPMTAYEWFYNTKLGSPGSFFKLDYDQF